MSFLFFFTNILKKLIQNKINETKFRKKQTSLVGIEIGPCIFAMFIFNNKFPWIYGSRVLKKSLDANK